MIFNKIFSLTIGKISNDDVYKLNKKYIPKNIDKIYISQGVIPKYNTINIDNNFDLEIRKCINNFINVVCNNFNREDLNIFYNNINELTVSKRKILLSRIIENKDIIGEYSLRNNNIKYIEGCLNDTIYHELFHMASSYYKDGVYYSGFNQRKGNKNVGVALNEGYTQVLTEEFFSCCETYYDQVRIVKNIIKIVGKDKMNSLYLNADLQGLIEELEKYSSIYDIMTFISYTDFMLNDKFIKSNEKVKKIIINEINLFLKDSYLNKNNKILKYNNISSL